MAEFSVAFEKTMSTEWVKDPADPGQETFCGISRRYHPNWAGWKVIDKIDDTPTLKNSELLDQVEAFYEDNFWTPIGCHLITDQQIANEMFDTAVNLGKHAAVLFLQQSINKLDRNSKSYANIAEDGGMGPQTLNALGQLLQAGDRKVLWKMMNVLQGYQYFLSMNKSPRLERFARGWFLNRVFED